MCGLLFLLSYLQGLEKLILLLDLRRFIRKTGLSYSVRMSNRPPYLNRVRWYYYISNMSPALIVTIVANNQSFFVYWSTQNNLIQPKQNYKNWISVEEARPANSYLQVPPISASKWFTVHLDLSDFKLACSILWQKQCSLFFCYNCQFNIV